MKPKLKIEVRVLAIRPDWYGVYVDAVQVGVGPESECRAAADDLRVKPVLAIELRDCWRGEPEWPGDFRLTRQ